jgi:hypothetical protein
MGASRPTFQFGANRLTAQGGRGRWIIVGIRDRDDSFGDHPKRDAKSGYRLWLKSRSHLSKPKKIKSQKIRPGKAIRFSGSGVKIQTSNAIRLANGSFGSIRLGFFLSQLPRRRLDAGRFPLFSSFVVLVGNAHSQSIRERFRRIVYNRGIGCNA